MERNLAIAMKDPARSVGTVTVLPEMFLNCCSMTLYGNGLGGARSVFPSSLGTLKANDNPIIATRIENVAIPKATGS